VATRREFLKSSGGALIAGALAKLGFDADEVLAQGESVEPDGEPLYRINPNAQYAEYAGYGTGMYSTPMFEYPPDPVMALIPSEDDGRQD